MKSKYKNLLNNTLIFALGSFGSKLITFLLVPLYTNVLSREEYGTADFVITCANMLVPIISLVIQDSVLRFALSRENNKEEVIKCSFIVMFVGAIFSVIFLPLIGLYPAISEWRYYLVIISISNMLNNVMLSYAKAIERNKLYAIVSMINAAVLACSNILFLVYLRNGIRGYLLSNIIAHLISVIILIIFTRAIFGIYHSRYNKQLMFQMINYSAPLILNNISWWILNSSDRVMVECYCSASELGLYTAAAKIPALLSIITTIFSQAWTVSAIKEYDEEKDKVFYEKVFKSFSLVMFFACSCVIFISKPFMKVYVGHEFFDSWVYVPFLVVGAVYYAYSMFFGAIYGALKKNASVAYTTIIAAVINVSINFALLREIGVFAAVISTAVSYFVIGIIRMIDSRRFFPLKIDVISFALNSLVICTQAVLVSLNLFQYVASGLAIFLLISINFRHIKEVVSFTLSLIRKRRIRRG